MESIVFSSTVFTYIYDVIVIRFGFLIKYHRLSSSFNHFVSLTTQSR